MNDARCYPTVIIKTTHITHSLLIIVKLEIPNALNQIQFHITMISYTLSGNLQFYLRKQPIKLTEYTSKCKIIIIACYHHDYLCTVVPIKLSPYLLGGLICQERKKPICICKVKILGFYLLWINVVKILKFYHTVD